MAFLGLSVQMSGLIIGILALVFGILIIKYPKIISTLIGAYLIITGLFTIIAAL